MGEEGDAGRAPGGEELEHHRRTTAQQLPQLSLRAEDKVKGWASFFHRIFFQSY